jgi:hypothetical protein
LIKAPQVAVSIRQFDVAKYAPVVAGLLRGVRAPAVSLLLAAGFLAGSASAAAQPSKVRVQTAAEALALDAEQYAARLGISLEEAVRRLRAQEATVPITDRIARALGHRLAGISIEHEPEYRLIVLLTGSQPVVDQAALAAGSPVPVVFRLGAAANRMQIVAAMREHRHALDAAIPNSRGMGLDPRTGELVLFVRRADAELHGANLIEHSAEALTGVPVRVEIADAQADMLRGGARLEGRSEVDGKRYACTTGFVVTDASRTGVITAAHCPDAIVYQEPDGTKVPLGFVGQWGARDQDVQVHVGPTAGQPLFYADRKNGALRPVRGARPRESTRAGDLVCHWGESSGYSCSEVQLTDYAPPGALCAGPCEPVWVTVKGPNCRSGDSGGPVFSGTVAFGILKGGSGIRSRCSFYYYMSTDYLPSGWSLLRTEPAAAIRSSIGVAQGARVR